MPENKHEKIEDEKNIDVNESDPLRIYGKSFSSSLALGVYSYWPNIFEVYVSQYILTQF